MSPSSASASGSSWQPWSMPGNKAGIADATSEEFGEGTHVIAILPEQEGRQRARRHDAPRELHRRYPRGHACQQALWRETDHRAPPPPVRSEPGTISRPWRRRGWSSRQRTRTGWSASNSPATRSSLPPSSTRSSSHGQRDHHRPTSGLLRHAGQTSGQNNGHHSRKNGEYHGQYGKIHHKSQ